GICVGALYDGDPWDFYSYKVQPKNALPLGTVLTLSATGSEMNKGSVITNEATKQKHGWGSIYSFPKFSILDPTLTYTVSPHQTACGVVDALTHIYEYYFNKGNKAYLNDRISEAIMKTIVKYGPIAYNDPTNYEARAALMWSSSLALNGITKFAKAFEGFNHITEHAISAIYDITHADGLSILGPIWMEYVLNEENVNKFYEFAVNVWDIKEDPDKMKVAKLGIARVFEYYKELNMPLTFNEVGITNPDLELIADKSLTKDTLGQLVPLNKEDIINILKKAI
ncbi:MAG: iron-containing alcohol dehydrogenase, partial [Candidatus Izemoplasma sp.]